MFGGGWAESGWVQTMEEGHHAPNQTHQEDASLGASCKCVCNWS